jgi:multidrug transporter EmrE-like cation transporter
MNWLLLVCGILCSVSAQLLLKQGTGLKLWSGRWLVLAGISALLYASSFAVYAWILRRQDISRVSPLMGTAVTALVVLGGVMFFGETLSLRRIIGVLLACAAVALLAG